MTAIIEITFYLSPYFCGDSRGIKFPVNRLHPDIKHLTSRVRSIRGFKEVSIYTEERVQIIAEAGDLDTLTNTVQLYLTKDRQAQLHNIIRRQIEGDKL